MIHESKHLSSEVKEGDPDPADYNLTDPPAKVDTMLSDEAELELVS